MVTQHANIEEREEREQKRGSRGEERVREDEKKRKEIGLRYASYYRRHGAAQHSTTNTTRGRENTTRNEKKREMKGEPTLFDELHASC